MKNRQYARKLNKAIVEALPKPDSAEAHAIRFKTDQSYRRTLRRGQALVEDIKQHINQEGFTA